MLTLIRALPHTRPAIKLAVVLAGYAAALLIALAVVAVYVYFTDSPDRYVSGGMSAFGDSLLFLAVLTLASIPPTGMVLYFLRPFPSFWMALAAAAVIYAATAIPALIDHFMLRAAGTTATPWSALLSLRLLLAPFSAFAFLLAALFAPGLWFRVPLFGAMAVEVGAFSCLAASWLIVR